MTQPSQPGASVADWAHWQSLGLTADLLPVVSDLSATISPTSKLSPASIGKVPSQIDRHGYVVGFGKWTDHVATDRKIERWAQEPRHGICLQTGKDSEVCVIDTDIGDIAVSSKVRQYIELIVGPLPLRYRKNSGKFAMIFRMPGKHVKRVINTAHGPIERLALGQELVLVGTHPSGVRYEWEGGLPTEIPEISPAVFEQLWTGLQDAWGVEPERISRVSKTRPQVPRKPGEVEDHIATFLEANNWVKSWADDGTINIRCPFEEEHSNAGDENESESATKYFPAGVGGYALGHWKCLHGHCVARQDHEYTDKIGLLDNEFEDLTTGTALTAEGTVIDVDAPPVVPGPRYMLTRGGEALATVNNLVMALERADQCGMRIRWDNFRDEIVWAPEEEGLMAWRAFRDHDYMELRGKLEKPRTQGGLNFKPIGREMIRDAVHYVAMKSQMDSAALWAESLVWDGVERVETFFSEYFNTVNNPYTRAVGLYLWSALAGRALVPGIKADMAVILKSEQGTVKTEGIKSMAPFDDAFGEIDLGKGDDVLARQTRGKLVCEISELRGLNSRDHGAIKSWVSRTHEEWVPKFKEFSTKFPRRFICIGSTNEDEFLADNTGERRWLPMVVGRTNLAGIKADREQLWAEGVHIFKHGYKRSKPGVQWAEAERLAKREHGKFKVQDSWHDVIVNWLNDEAFGDLEGICQGDSPVRMHQLLQSALNLNVQNITRKDELRAGAVLRAEGYEPVTLRAPSVFSGRKWSYGVMDVGQEPLQKRGKVAVFRAWVNPERVEAARALREAANELG